MLMLQTIHYKDRTINNYGREAEEIELSIRILSAYIK